MDELEPKELGETGEEEMVDGADDAELLDEELGDDEGDELAGSQSDVGDAPIEEVETASYEITGLVDKFDEQGNITGQLDIGSIQVLPVAIGDKAVAEGRANRVE